MQFHKISLPLPRPWIGLEFPAGGGGGLKLNKWTFQRVGGNLEQNSSVEGYKYFLELHIIFCVQNLQMNVHQPGPPLW